MPLPEILPAEVDREGKPVVRGEGGRWLVPPKGGRPKGSSQSDLVRKLIEPKRQALVDAALDMALHSDDPHAKARAIDITLSYLAPRPRPEGEKVEVPGLSEATSFTGKADAIIAAVASGDISAEAGERILRLLDVYRKALETDDLARRIAALEAGRTIESTQEPSPEDLA